MSITFKASRNYAFREAVKRKYVRDCDWLNDFHFAGTTTRTIDGHEETFDVAVIKNGRLFTVYLFRPGPDGTEVVCDGNGYKSEGAVNCAWKNYDHRKLWWTRGDRAGGTCRQGVTEATYEELVSLFGQPDEGDGEKTDAEWIVVFRDGLVATIYNWKNGPNFGGGPVDGITRWHIGGTCSEAVTRVERVIANSRPL